MNNYKTVTFGTSTLPWILCNSGQNIGLSNKQIEFLKKCPCYSFEELQPNFSLYNRYKQDETPKVGSLVEEISPFYDTIVNFGDIDVEIGVHKTCIGIYIQIKESDKELYIDQDIMEELDAFIDEYYRSLEKKSARS